MKGIVKKNQIIITSLAILIAVAGYLNYSEKNLKDMTGNSKEAAELVNDASAKKDGISDVSNEALRNYEDDSLLDGTDDILSNDYDVDSNEVNGEVSTNAQGESSEEEQNSTADGTTDAASDENGTDIDEVPGTAVLTNVGTFSANARLQREQLRAKNKETLLNMINSGNLSDEQKSEITDEMLHITQIAEMENEIETLLEAKGFTGAVVSIADESVDVVINMTDVTDSGRAQIEDIVKRKTSMPASNIVITPISVEN